MTYVIRKVLSAQILPVPKEISKINDLAIEAIDILGIFYSFDKKNQAAKKYKSFTWVLRKHW